jgi:hypothetical protein
MSIGDISQDHALKKTCLKTVSRSIRRQNKRRYCEVSSSKRKRALKIRRKALLGKHILTRVILVPDHLRYYARKKIRKVIEDFFAEVDDRLKNGQQVILDFSKVERLYPCGLLILMGWVTEWTKDFPRKISAKYPKNDLVEQMLQRVAVLEQLGLPPRKQTVDHDDVKRWHYFHGKNADATPLEPFFEELKVLLGEEKQVGLGNCITEAMINVGHHAYKNGGPWWSFATISKNTIFIGLYDRGESVPATLLSKPLISDYLTAKMWFEERGDGQLITAAVGGRTRTQLPYRGKGLPEMLEFTKSSPDSELGIFSRYGYFVYDDQKLESTGRLSSLIKGTLVLWKLNLSEVKDD